MTVTVEPQAQFRFDAEAHAYWLGAVRLDGVTEVLRGVGFVNLDYATPRALSRGRAIHHATALDDQGRLNYETLHPDLRGYLAAWRRCHAETSLEVLAIERALYHPLYKFAGTLDRLVKWKGYEYVLDLKTVGAPGALGPAWACFQTAGYDLMLPKAATYRKRASILLYPDGTWKPDYHEDFNDGNFFIAFLTTYRQLKKHGKAQ